VIIGVTGGIGSGKSEAIRELGQMDFYIIDADAVARDLIHYDTRIQNAIRKAFGPGFFDSKHRLQRRELGKIVFSDPAKMAMLNRIVWPPLIRNLKEKIGQLQTKDKAAKIAVDIAILFEAKLESLFDIIVVITAPLENRIKWLKMKRKWTKKEIMDRIHSQMDIHSKKDKADYVISNSGTLDDLKKKIRSLIETIESDCK
jgi:dephospho-CoA kinase